MEKKVGVPAVPAQAAPPPMPKTGPGFNVKTSEKKGAGTEQTIDNWWRGILSGKQGRFTPERVAMEKQKLWETEKGRERQLLDRTMRSDVARGIARSGLASRGARQINLETAQRISAGEREIKFNQIQAEFEDKMAALQMAQKALDSKRNYELGKEQIAATREATRARTALGYAQIDAQKKIAARQAGIAAARLGFNREQFQFQKDRYEESKIPIPEEMHGTWGTDKIPPGTYDRIFGSGF